MTLATGTIDNDDEWVRLEAVDDWGGLGFRLPSDEAAVHGIIKVADDDRVMVKWPDGCLSNHVIRLVPVAFSYVEQGPGLVHGERDEAHVVVNVHGHEVLVRLDRVDVLRSWVIAHGGE